MDGIAIKVKNLSKNFGATEAVKDISFEVGQSEIFAFLGPNGAGKTTTINILCGLLRPTSGEAFVNGFNVQSASRQVRASIGIIFQDPSLDERLTAYENLDFHGMIYHMPKAMRKGRIEEVLDLVGLSEKRRSIVKTFSGGMKRRLEIARGLMHRPRVLFLDEPTIGLDPQTRKYIWDYILGLSRNERMTIFFTTHYMDEAEVSERVAIIDRGSIAALGEPSALKEKFNLPSLNDLFLKLTGYNIRDEKSDPVVNLKRVVRQGRLK